MQIPVGETDMRPRDKIRNMKREAVQPPAPAIIYVCPRHGLNEVWVGSATKEQIRAAGCVLCRNRQLLEELNEWRSRAGAPEHEG